jgi:serine O-acetyltransferase
MKLWREITADFRAALDRDPAAEHWLEVALAYPGVHAVIAHRFIHRLNKAGMPIVPRVLSNIMRHLTGIEIHPAAKIGAGLFIDHGMGVVIGSTTVIGENVTIYQGVTLGGTTLERGEKRHPTIGNDVVVGVGASVLGNIHVGDGARVGGGSVVVKNVQPGTTVVGIPARTPTPRGAERHLADLHSSRVNDSEHGIEAV